MANSILVPDSDIRFTPGLPRGKHKLTEFQGASLLSVYEQLRLPEVSPYHY